MKRNLFVVNTIYQLFVAIVIKEKINSGIPSDILLTSRSGFLKEVYETEKLLSNFDNQFYLEYEEIKYLKRNRIFRFGYECFCYEKFIQKVFSDKFKDYSDIYFFNATEIIQMIYRKLSQKENTKFHLFEEGTVSYLRDTIPIGRNLLYKKILQYLSKTDSIYNLDYDVYLFHPDCYVGKKTKEFHMIPHIEKDDYLLKDKLNNSMMYKNIEINQKYIFFEECYEFFEDVDLYKKLVYAIAEMVGPENFVLKRHPRNKENIFDSRINILKCNVPWELITMNGGAEGKVLLTISSTAAITPKMIFDADCVSILLYELFDKRTTFCKEEFAIDLLQKVQLIYRNVYIPRDMEELKKTFINIEHLQ